MIKQRLRRRIAALIMAAGIALLSLSGIAAAEPQPPVGPPASAAADSYTLRLFTDTTVLRNPNESVSGYFDVMPGSSINDTVLLDLWYSYSPTTKAELSFITVSINGVPVVSRPLEPAQASMVNWQVPLPANQVKNGFNEVNIAVVHRSIDGLCRDIDNEANWFIIRPETRISFKLNRSPYTLASYPAPFLNEYLGSKINTAFYLPEQTDAPVLASLFNMATQWGARGLSGVPQLFEVRYGAPGQVPANEIVIGLSSQLLANQPLAPKTAFLRLEALPGGLQRLLISGEDSQSLAKGMDALARPQLVKSLFGQEVTLTTNLPAEKASGAKKDNGSYTLADLGYPQDLPVAGAFHQEAIVTVPRPANYKVGDGSYVELHFRHAPILDPKKSAVTIYINDVPIRSTALLTENAEGGILKAPIPASELNKAAWRIRFGFYHDLGIIDCSKRYDEVAWSVVEKETRIVLEPGDVERLPVLEDFPNNFYMDNNGTMPLTMILPDQPTAADLTAALKLAYFIGQQNKGKISWQVQFAATFDAGKAPGSMIAIGRQDNYQQWKPLKKYLPVTPEENGAYHLADWLEVMPASLQAFDMYQVGKIDDDKLVYAFMYVSPERLSQFMNFSLMNGNTLTGQLTLVDGQGNRSGFAQHPAAVKTSAFAWAKKLWSFHGGAAQIYVGVFVAVLLGTAALLFYVRKRS